MNHDKVPKLVWLPEVAPIWQQIHNQSVINTKNISITTSGQISIATNHIEQIPNQG